MCTCYEFANEQPQTLSNLPEKGTTMHLKRYTSMIKRLDVAYDDTVPVGQDGLRQQDTEPCGKLSALLFIVRLRPF